MEAIANAFLTLKRHHRKSVIPYRITLKQFHVLRQLKKCGALYPSEIADMLFCDRPTATVVIKNMEKQGWVKRKLDKNDSRRIKVTLEPAGEHKLEEIALEKAGPQSKSFELFSCFNREEKKQLSGLLARLIQHLKQLEDNNHVQLRQKDIDSSF